MPVANCMHGSFHNMGGSVICASSPLYIYLETVYMFMVKRSGEELEKMEESRESVRVKKEEEAENGELLKRKISDHPLFATLVENHLKCLQVGGITHSSKYEWLNQRKVDHKPLYGVTCRSELDSFMEGYCLALSKLKEAMEEPQLETLAFFKNVYSQLGELTTDSPKPENIFLDNKSGAAKWGSGDNSTNSDVANSNQE